MQRLVLMVGMYLMVMFQKHAARNVAHLLEIQRLRGGIRAISHSGVERVLQSPQCGKESHPRVHVHSTAGSSPSHLAVMYHDFVI